MRPAEQVRYLVLAAQRDGNRWLAQELRLLSLTPAQAEVIRVLADRAKPDATGVGLDELGALLICESGTNPSRLVDRLVRDHFVERVSATDDRRRIRLALTETGRAADAAIRQIEQALYTRIDAALGPDPRELIEQLTALCAGQPAGLAFAARVAGSRV